LLSQTIVDVITDSCIRTNPDSGSALCYSFYVNEPKIEASGNYRVTHSIVLQCLAGSLRAKVQ